MSAVSKVRYPAVISDQMQFFFQRDTDSQIRGVVSFSTRIDAELMRRAIRLSLLTVPLLGCRFVEADRHPFWEAVDYADDTLFILREAENIEDDINKFLVQKIDFLSGPQIRTGIFRSGADRLCIVMNHMVADAASFKQYMYLLARIYSKLKKDQQYLPPGHADYGRGLEQVLKQLKPADILKLLRLGFKRTDFSGDTYFYPAENNRTGNLLIKTKGIPPERFIAIKEFGKGNRATINDVLLTAFYKALFNTLLFEAGKALKVAITVDLRCYLPDKKENEICNLKSFIPVNMEYNPGESFRDTLVKVRDRMNFIKSNYPGLGVGLLPLVVLFRTLPYSVIKRNFGKLYKPPPIEFTNLGIIDSTKLIFEGTDVADAFITGSIRYAPYFSMSASSFNQTLTFNVNHSRSGGADESVSRFLSALYQEMPG